jgi:alkylation response protein AidB-like acyl-CoA dehydrogenase
MILDAEDRQLIAETVDKFITDNYAHEDREGRHNDGHKFGRHWQDFAGLGWLLLTPAPDAGGMGGGIVDAQVLMRAFGRGLIREPFAEAGLTALKTLELAAPAAQQATLLAPFISGAQKLICAHTETSGEPGFDAIHTTATATADGFCLNGRKGMIYQASCADMLLVSAQLDGHPALLLVPATSPGLSADEFTTIDSRYASDLTFTHVQLPATALVASGAAAATAVREGILFTLAALLAEYEGIATSLCRMTADYMRTREQFGSKISQFQALQHMLADMVIAEEEIKALTWMVASIDPLDTAAARERTIRMATARAATAARSLAENAVQLHGGIGVTNELVIGHYLRRIIALDSMYGDAQQHLLWLASGY